METNCNDIPENNCGLFDFMANTIGIKVLHPGGYEATNNICKSGKLNKDSVVLDLACGSGTTSFYLSKKYNCNIYGIDISDTLIKDAKTNLKSFKNKTKINFEVADAFKLPFADNTFDAVISQAFFILIDNKEKVLDEIYRVLKPEGYFGSLELSWYKTPTNQIYDELLLKTCNNFIPRMLKFEEWEKFFLSKKFQHIKTIKNPMTSGMLQMLKAEGLNNFIKIINKITFNTKYRNRMMEVQKTFKKYNDYVGYGIFSFTK